MTQTTKIDPKTAKQILSGLGLTPADFDYSGRTFKLAIQTKISFWNTNWDGGSKNDYTVIRADLERRQAANPAPWINTIEGFSYDLTPEFIVIEHTFFCGKDLGLTFHINPALAPKWLPG